MLNPLAQDFVLGHLDLAAPEGPGLRADPIPRETAPLVESESPLVAGEDGQHDLVDHVHVVGHRLEQAYQEPRQAGATELGLEVDLVAVDYGLPLLNGGHQAGKTVDDRVGILDQNVA